jgi:hypothetical protein
MSNRVATFVKDVSKHFRGVAYLYHVSPVIKYSDEHDDEIYTEYVVVSSIDTTHPRWMYGVDDPLAIQEVGAFPADSEGNVVSWGEVGMCRDVSISEFMKLMDWTLTLEEQCT